MNGLLLIRSHMGTVYALGVVFLVAVALSALKFSIPDVIPGAELLVFGWLGVALGRLAVGAGADPVAPPKPETDPVAAPKPEAGAKSERLDAIVREIVTLVQAQAKESDAFAERLNGANTRLAQQTDATSVRDIVLALIEDNRHMRDKLADVRDQLELEAAGAAAAKRPRALRGGRHARRGDADRQPALFRRDDRSATGAGAPDW